MTTQPVLAALGSPDMNRPSVLIVDDEPDNFDAIEALLGDCGYDLHYAIDGQHAIDSLDTFKPDLVLLDVMMPDDDRIARELAVATFEHMDYPPDIWWKQLALGAISMASIDRPNKLQLNTN